MIATTLGIRGGRLQLLLLLLFLLLQQQLLLVLLVQLLEVKLRYFARILQRLPKDGNLIMADCSTESVGVGVEDANRRKHCANCTHFDIETGQCASPRQFDAQVSARFDQTCFELLFRHGALAQRFQNSSN